jgi:hypothetical protein
MALDDVLNDGQTHQHNRLRNYKFSLTGRISLETPLSSRILLLRCDDYRCFQAQSR